MLRAKLLSRVIPRNSARFLSSIPTHWGATYDPNSAGDTEPYAVPNLVNGEWTHSRESMEIIHPLNRDARPIFTIPNTQADELGPFYESLRQCPKSGLHNPLKNPERYLQYGDISRKVGLFTLVYLGNHY